MWYDLPEFGEEEELNDQNWSKENLKRSNSSSSLRSSTGSLQRKRNFNNLQKETLEEKVRDIRRGVGLFGTVPPPKKLEMEKVKDIAASVANSIRELNADGIIVYDIQDEPSRNGTERPFPFFHTHDPSMYARLLTENLPDSETIVYRAMLPGETEEEFTNWLKKSQEYGHRNLVFVGGSRVPDMSLLSIPEALRLTQHRFPDEFFIGGITIPERHRDRLNEHTRIQEKVDNGISFFTSQVIYNADNAIWLLQDYDHLCKEQGKKPVRIFFTFAPFGTENTVRFLEWLGVEVPEGTKKRVLSRSSLKACIEESMQICWENFKRILDASQRLRISVPLGFSVESVSKSRMEQRGAIQLYKALKEQMDDYYYNLGQMSPGRIALD